MPCIVRADGASGEVLAFDGPLAQPPVFGFTDLPSLPWNGAVFQTDGSIQTLGGIRFGDQRGNYLEVRVEPAATARVWLRKWDGANWLAQAEGDPSRVLWKKENGETVRVDNKPAT